MEGDEPAAIHTLMKVRDQKVRSIARESADMVFCVQEKTQAMMRFRISRTLPGQRKDWLCFERYVHPVKDCVQRITEETDINNVLKKMI